jgi:hypothetical protein
VPHAALAHVGRVGGGDGVLDGVEQVELDTVEVLGNPLGRGLRDLRGRALAELAVVSLDELVAADALGAARARRRPRSAGGRPSRTAPGGRRPSWPRRGLCHGRRTRRGSGRTPAPGAARGHSSRTGSATASC